MRILVLVFILFISAAPALAQSENARFCSGKYDKASSIISEPFLRYGTLYAGGNFFHVYNQDLRPTIDTYRLLTNQLKLTPDNAPDRYKSSYDMNGYGEPRAEPVSTYIRANQALKIMTHVDPQMHRGEVRDAVITLDLLTSRGPADDWWLRPDDFHLFHDKVKRPQDFKTQEQYYTYRLGFLSNAQKHIAHIATENEALDWLQTALILSADRYPWRHGGQTITPDMQNLLAHIEEKALENKDINVWYALFAHHQYYGRALPTEIQLRANVAIAQVHNCEASSKTYAALAAGGFELPDNAISQALLQLRLVNQAKLLTVQATRKDGLDIGYYYQIEFLKDRAPMKSAFALPLMLSAPSILEVRQAHKLSPTVTRPLVWLSNDNLAKVAPGTAFTHYLSLGEVTEAAKLLEMWFAENELNRAPFADIMGSGLSENITLSLTALRMQCLSHFISDFCRPQPRKVHLHRNLGSHRNSSEFVRRELAEWLYPSFEAYKGHQNYYRQYLGQYFRRNGFMSEKRGNMRWRFDASKGRSVANVSRRGLGSHNRNPVMERGPVPTLYSDGPLYAPQGMAALSDEKKLEMIASEKRYVRVLSLNIVNWVDGASAVELENHRDLMSEALHRIVILNKHESGGEYSGMPIAQKAYQILHSKFSGTKWAKETPYWWPSRKEHG